MSARKNEDRLKAPKSKQSKQPELPPTPEEFKPDDTLTFVTPTEFVEIPSAGRFYPSTHPLHNVDTIEIRHMTAKDEDILASSALLKKGIAIDRFLQNIIVDKRIKISQLLVGDKNALVVASRITGYGPQYDTRMACPSCSTKTTHSFDLSALQLYTGETALENYPELEVTENNTFITVLPKSQLSVEFRLMTSDDETKLTNQAEAKRKNNLPESSFTSQLKMIVLSINGQEDRRAIYDTIDSLPALDSRYLRNLYTATMPTVDLGHDFVCFECAYEDRLEVPFTSDFFWPR